MMQPKSAPTWDQRQPSVQGQRNRLWPALHRQHHWEMKAYSCEAISDKPTMMETQVQPNPVNYQHEEIYFQTHIYFEEIDI